MVVLGGGALSYERGTPVHSVLSEEKKKTEETKTMKKMKKQSEISDSSQVMRLTARASGGAGSPHTRGSVGVHEEEERHLSGYQAHNSGLWWHEAHSSGSHVMRLTTRASHSSNFSQLGLLVARAALILSCLCFSYIRRTKNKTKTVKKTNTMRMMKKKSHISEVMRLKARASGGAGSPHIPARAAPHPLPPASAECLYYTTPPWR